MKFTYNTKYGEECVAVDMGTKDEQPFIRISNSVGTFTEIYAQDLGKLMANLMLANEYIKENKA